MRIKHQEEDGRKTVNNCLQLLVWVTDSSERTHSANHLDRKPHKSWGPKLLLVKVLIFLQGIFLLTSPRTWKDGRQMVEDSELRTLAISLSLIKDPTSTYYVPGTGLSTRKLGKYPGKIMATTPKGVVHSGPPYPSCSGNSAAAEGGCSLPSGTWFLPVSCGRTPTAAQKTTATPWWAGCFSGRER